MDASTLPRRALVAVAYTQWAYWCSLVMAVMAVRWIPEGYVHKGVILTPVLTTALCLATAFWLYEDCDEFLRSAVLPFYSTKKTGSGLGLALCRDIVDAHGGKLAIAPRDGGGMVVSVWLPGPRLMSSQLG